MDSLNGFLKTGKFDAFLQSVSQHGLLTLKERRKVNRAGDKVYETHMHQFLDAHKTDRVYKRTNHLNKTLTHQIKEDGHYEIGFSKKGKKAYVARLLNDGFDVRNQYGGPYRHVQPAEWHDFISRIGKQCDQEMGREMATKAHEILEEKGESLP